MRIITIIKIILPAICVIFIEAVIYAFLCVTGYFSLTGDTQNDVQMALPSPNGAYIASVVNKYGGATVSNATFVCIRPKGEMLKESTESVIFRLLNVSKVEVHWDSNEQLTVNYDPEVVTYKRDVWRGVKVLYLEHRFF